MSVLKRIPLKYMRDRAKSRYIKAPNCYICRASGSLDFHHLFTLDILFDNWISKNKIQIDTAEDIMAVRDEFIAEHEYELFDYARTLCKACHKRLHTVYGQRPALTTAAKQERWLDKQREKHAGRILD